MRGELFDHVSRKMGTSQSRRDAAKLMLASALTLVTAGALPKAAEAAEGDEVSAQRAPAYCRRNAARCKRVVRQYCWDWYPNSYGTCTNQNLPCCNFYTRCKNGRAIDCIRRKGW
jgi:hypothetical protein